MYQLAKRWKQARIAACFGICLTSLLTACDGGTTVEETTVQETIVQETTVQETTVEETIAEETTANQSNTALPNPIQMVESAEDFDTIGLNLNLPANEQWYSNPVYSIIDGRIAQIQFYDEIVQSDALVRAGESDQEDFSGIYHTFDSSKEQTQSVELADGSSIDILIQITQADLGTSGVLVSWSHRGSSYYLWEKQVGENLDAVVNMAIGIAEMEN